MLTLELVWRVRLHPWTGAAEIDVTIEFLGNDGVFLLDRLRQLRGVRRIGEGEEVGVIESLQGARRCQHAKSVMGTRRHDAYILGADSPTGVVDEAFAEKVQTVGAGGGEEVPQGRLRKLSDRHVVGQLRVSLETSSALPL